MLRSSQGTGRPRKLAAAQERQVFRWINGKNPNQYGFEFALWTRGLVRALIQREFGVSLSLASVGTLLARLGLTPQKPLQRAYQRDPQAIERWQRERPIPRSRNRLRKRKRTSTSGTNPGFAPTQSMGRPGVSKARRPSFKFLDNGKASVRRLP
jgi:transposase